MKQKVEIALSLCFCILFYACKGNTTQEKENIDINVIKVTSKQMNKNIEFPFIAQPFRSSELSFRVGGPINQLNSYSGNYYRRGDVIAEIDNRDFRISKERAEAIYKQAKAEYERIRILHEKNNLSASTYEKAKADYTSAKTAYETASNNLNDTRLVAPFNGYVGEVYAEKYQDIRASQPVLTFIDIDQLKIEAYVTQDIAFRVQKGKMLPIRFDVAPDKAWEAQIIEISKSTTANNLSYLLTATLANANKQFLAGMSGKIYFSHSSGSESSSLSIPQTALCHRPSEGDYVWVVNTTNETVHKRKVVAGDLTPNGWISINSGLQENETIANSGLRFLSDGMKVSVKH